MNEIIDCMLLLAFYYEVLFFCHTFTNIC